jgi:hypothetical protein
MFLGFIDLHSIWQALAPSSLSQPLHNTIARNQNTRATIQIKLCLKYLIF